MANYTPHFKNIPWQSVVPLVDSLIVAGASQEQIVDECCDLLSSVVEALEITEPVRNALGLVVAQRKPVARKEASKVREKSTTTEEA